MRGDIAQTPQDRTEVLLVSGLRRASPTRQRRTASLARRRSDWVYSQSLWVKTPLISISAVVEELAWSPTIGAPIIEVSFGVKHGRAITSGEVQRAPGRHGSSIVTIHKTLHVPGAVIIEDHLHVAHTSSLSFLSAF